MSSNENVRFEKNSDVIDILNIEVENYSIWKHEFLNFPFKINKLLQNASIFIECYGS